MLDRWLDGYESLWQAGGAAPVLEDFLTAAAAELPPEWHMQLRQELALIDLEHRWRRFYRLHDARLPGEQAELLPLLPTWSDYRQRLNLSTDAVEGICREFRVRQAFGDSPDCDSFASTYADYRLRLTDELPRIAAELSGAKVSLCHGGRTVLAFPLTGHLEVGRRRVGEPEPPALEPAAQGCRLIVADLTATRLSRKQFSLVVVARGRVRVQHHTPKGKSLVNFQTQLSGTDSCVAELPVWVNFHDWSLYVGP